MEFIFLDIRRRTTWVVPVSGTWLITAQGGSGQAEAGRNVRKRLRLAAGERIEIIPGAPDGWVTAELLRERR